MVDSQASESREIFEKLVGTDLAAVTFVRDYVQLQFEGGMLNVYTPLTIECAPWRAVSGSAEFANLVLAQIGKFVREVALRPKQALEIRFVDGSSISISLHPNDYVCPEAVYFTARKGHDWAVL